MEAAVQLDSFVFQYQVGPWREDEGRRQRQTLSLDWEADRTGGAASRHVYGTPRARAKRQVEVQVRGVSD